MDGLLRDTYSAQPKSDSKVVVRRDRLCIPVRAGRQGELPRGSVTLATSASGATLYLEPAPLVQLNNAEALLAGRERDEERRVLRRLSGAVASHAPALLQACLLLETVSVLTSLKMSESEEGGS